MNKDRLQCIAQFLVSEALVVWKCTHTYLVNAKPWKQKTTKCLWMINAAFCSRHHQPVVKLMDKRRFFKAALKTIAIYINNRGTIDIDTRQIAPLIIRVAWHVIRSPDVLTRERACAFRARWNNLRGVCVDSFLVETMESGRSAFLNI